MSASYAATPGPPKAAGEGAQLSRSAARRLRFDRFGHAVTVVCESCHSILDARIRSCRFCRNSKQRRAKIRRSFPWARAARFAARTYEVIGFQRRHHSRLKESPTVGTNTSSSIRTKDFAI